MYFFPFKFCVCVFCLRVPKYTMHAFRGQKRVLGPLKLELQELSAGPLEEQSVLESLDHLSSPHLLI